MAKFKVVTPAGTSYGAPGASYDYEMEALAPLGAEIVEIAAKGEDEFAAAVRECDALYAKGRPITRRMIGARSLPSAASASTPSTSRPPPPGASR